MKGIILYLEHKSHPSDVREPSGYAAQLLLLEDEVNLSHVPYKSLDN